MEFKLLDYVYLLCSYFKFYLCLKYVGGQLKENNNSKEIRSFFLYLHLYLYLYTYNSYNKKK